MCNIEGRLKSCGRSQPKLFKITTKKYVTVESLEPAVKELKEEMMESESFSYK